MGAVFAFSGLGKIMAPAMTQGYIASVGLPLPLAAYLVAILIELGGGLLLIAGFQTRIVAIFLAVFTLATAVFSTTTFPTRMRDASTRRSRHKSGRYGRENRHANAVARFISTLTTRPGRDDATKDMPHA